MLMMGWVLQVRFLVMCCLVGFGFSFERLESFGGGGREGIEEIRNHVRVSKRCFHSSLTVVKVVVVLKLWVQ
jgi:hypothetical protein